ncbi:MAG: hypothetical protein PCFJNLEI_00193 [Verrucomicrobiae bacterium]|nr:hypothetical protein [Verrucomicrobiae bacterium]
MSFPMNTQTHPHRSFQFPVIADCFQGSCPGVRWLVDASLTKSRCDVVSRPNRFMLRLGLWAVVSWFVLMIVAILHGGGSP